MAAVCVNMSLGVNRVCHVQHQQGLGWVLVYINGGHVKSVSSRTVCVGDPV